MQENSVDGMHDPNFASKYEDKAEAKEVSKRIPRDCKIQRLKTWQNKGNTAEPKYRTLRLKSEKLNKMPPKNPTANEVFNWRLGVHKGGEDDIVDYEVYIEWKDLYQVFNHLYNFETYSNYDCGESYLAVQIWVNKGSKWGTFKREIKKCIPHVTHLDNGYKVFPIFDHECGSCDSRALQYKSEDDCKIVSVRYGEELFEGSLKECFEEMKSQYYYE